MDTDPHADPENYDTSQYEARLTDADTTKAEEEKQRASNEPPEERQRSAYILPRLSRWRSRISYGVRYPPSSLTFFVTLIGILTAIWVAGISQATLIATRRAIYENNESFKSTLEQMTAQANALRNTASDTHDLAGAAKAQSQQAEAQTKKMEESLARTDALIKQATAQAVATNDLAQAAQMSATVSNNSLNEIRANFARDQRPWVFISKLEIPNEPEAGKEIQVQFFFFNTGKTPALSVIVQSRPILNIGEPAFSDFTLTGLIPSRLTIPPGTLGTTMTLSAYTSPLIIPAQAIAVYQLKLSSFYLHAKLSYDDINGIHHWTTVCAFHRFGAKLDEWNFCAVGNDSDRQ